jgi:hypothetical protein
VERITMRRNTNTKTRTTAKQLVAWLGEGRTHAGELAERMEKSVKRSKPEVTALRRLFKYDESLDTYKRKPRKTMTEEYFERHGREDRPPPPKSAQELMELQEQRELAREREYQKAHGHAANMRNLISEFVRSLEDQGLL